MTAAIESLINQGRYFEARYQAQVALKRDDSPRIRQLLALATSKAGVPKAALEILEPLYRQHTDDPEMAGIMGSIYKEIFRKDQDTKFALLSRDTYLNNFTQTKNYYTGINAATMSAIAGQVAKGREIAGEVVKLIGTKAPDFWQQVTLAEAYLLVKEREKSVAAYIEAKKQAGKDWGRITSVHNQLWLLNHYVPVPKEIIRIFTPPGVVCFIGHMIDHPTRTEPRFPPSIENQVRDAIAGAINTLNARIGFCSLACGSDILFAETMAAVGGELNIWLPFGKEDFIEASVRFGGESWVERFERLISRFQVNYISHEPYGGFDDIFSFNNRVIFGSAVIRGAMNHTEPTLITVLSETDLKSRQGGTRDTLSVWPFPLRQVNINPDNYLSSSTVTAAPSKVLPRPKYPDIDRPVLFVVAADIPLLTKVEQEKVWTKIHEDIDISLLSPVTFEVGTTLIVSFKSILGAMDLVKVILREMKTHFLLDKLRISLYAAPVQLEAVPGTKEKTFLKESKARLLGLHSLVPSGAVFAFARFSSALSLDVNHYSVDYAGVVTAEWFPEPLEIFRVNTMEGQGRAV